MRRKDREIPKEFALTVADICTYAALSTVNEDGTPYCIPVTIVRKDDAIYFHSAKEGQKITNMRLRPEVCIACTGTVQIPEETFTVEYESAIITGTAEEITENREKTEALRLLCLRHTPNNMHHFDDAIAKSLSITAVWKVKINTITGKQKSVSYTR